MFKNNFNSFKLKNFFKSGMYLDYFLKKKVNKKLLKINKLSIFFSEKIVLEDIFIYTYTYIHIYLFSHTGGIFKKKNFLINFIKILVFLLHFYLIFFKC